MDNTLKPKNNKKTTNLALNLNINPNTSILLEILPIKAPTVFTAG